MTTQVNVSPNPFNSTLSFEVLVESQISAIVQIIDKKNKIIKMMSWNLKKGTNTTSFDNLDPLPAGEYLIDIKNIDGALIFDTKITKL
ncbi:MAG: hypothetical protein WKF89_02285 [Chitinophagaceae bacterium]